MRRTKQGGGSPCRGPQVARKTHRSINCKSCPDQDEHKHTSDRAEPDHQQDGARDRIVDELERPWQTRTDNKRQHKYADHPVYQHR